MMKSILEQLQSDEAVLLMYVAGELPPRDMAEVEKRLAQDSALCAQLEELRRAMGSMEQHLAGAGRVDDISVARAIRQTTSAMRARAAEERPAPAEEPEAEVWRIPGWMYPAAAAAILLVAVSLYLANMQPPQDTVASYRPDAYTPDLGAMLAVEPPEPDAISVAEQAEDLAATFDDSEWILADALSGDGLVGAMAELGEIQRLSGEMASAGESVVQ